MDLYLGAPFKYINRSGLGYALSHEMNDNKVIETYRSLSGLILDNGADELGEGEGGARLAYLAGRLQPNYLILPDVLHKDKKTRKRGEKFYEEMRAAGYHGKFMGVIQAKNLDEGLKSYEFWDKSGMVDLIGVTYDTKIKTNYAKLPFWGNRLNFLSTLAQSKEYRKGNKTGIHLLGTLEVLELFRLTRNEEFKGALDMVVTHDTTAPYACPTKFIAGDYLINFGRKKNWPRQDFNVEFTSDEQSIRSWNVACYLAACKIPVEKWERYLHQDLVNYYYEGMSFDRYY